MAKCADPVLCYLDSKGNRKYRNFSFARKSIAGIPQNHIVLDCGKCLRCRKKKAYELACRCVLHASLYKQNCFLTLTYDEKKEGYHNGFEYSDIQKFKKRLRQYALREYGRRIEVFNVHEYGKNGKKHWHLVVFNLQFRDRSLFTTRNSIPYFISEDLKSLWKFGNHTIGDVNEASAMYQAQYMEKDFKNHHVGTLKKSHSKHSGIGRPYFEQHYKQILTLGYVPINGKKLPVPRYFQKLASKHWYWFNDRSAFSDTQQRKALFRTFATDTDASEEIAGLYASFKLLKAEKIKELEKAWDDVISHFLTTGDDPDFIKSNDNALYDLRNKQNAERF